ncbi:MAG: hypothetical protein AB7G23_11215 [Vicinamibacterales bacterium]
MNDDPADLDDAALGEPVAELAGLSLDGGDPFQRKVRGRIERRVLTGELLSLAWTVPLGVVMELLAVPFELFSRSKRP